jgi:hypothetical protein
MSSHTSSYTSAADILETPVGEVSVQAVSALSVAAVPATPSPEDPASLENLAPAPLFIVSMWRAGSSLLYALLNQHPQVALAYEADLPLLMPVFLKPARWRDWPERWEFWNSALGRHRVPSGIAPDRASNHLLDRSTVPSSFRAVFSRVHRDYAARKGATIWGDKSPNYYDRMTWLAREFPGARFIIVWRSPVDTARSMERAAESGSSYFRKRGIKTRALVGYRVLRTQYQALVLLGVPVHTINYEDLIRDTDATMRGVCEFLQIPFDPRVLTLENSDRSATYDEMHHRVLRGDKVVAHKNRAEVLDAAWRAKIGRYLRLWRRQENGDWPEFPHLVADGAEVANAEPGFSGPALSEPAMSERLIDQASYRFWKFFDWFTAFAYSFVPLGILRRHRDRHREQRRA